MVDACVLQCQPLQQLRSVVLQAATALINFSHDNAAAAAAAAAAVGY
jgi:hypothetical protein